MSETTSPPVSDEDSIQLWVSFLSSYANPPLPLTGIPNLPPLPLIATDNSHVAEYEADFDSPVYDSVEITPHVARRVREYYRRHSFLPPPRAPLEELREQCIRQYDLYSAQQVENVQAATDLIYAFFGGLCTFTLFRDNVQVITAVSGQKQVCEAVGLFPGKRLLPETSLCGHSILYPSGHLHIPDLAKDWRYSGNPYADEIKGIKSYFGSVVWLKVDQSSTTDERVVPIGVINSMHLDDFLPSLDEQQRKVMEHVTRMLETQLRATWEGHERTREARARRAVSNMIDMTLVEAPSDSAGYSLESSAVLAAKQMKGVLSELEVVGIMDVRSLHSIAGGRHVLGSRPPAALAWECGGTEPDLTQAGDAVIHFLQQHHANPATTYRLTNPSGLEPFLPLTTSSHVAMPFFSGDQPLFIVVAAASRPSYSFRPDEVNFLRSMGVILRAQIVQSRVIEADAAKTAFLSSISHELRTPMHGVLSGLQLVRDAIDGGEHVDAERLLRMTESSGHALERILNDVLDFGSIANGRKVERTKGMADLGEATMAAVRTCYQGMDAGKVGKVEMSVELEERGWNANIDEAGFQRILFNGLTNAIKFTQSGRIILSLTSSADNRSVVCRVTDTGPGIDPQFASKLFEPFTKQNPFTPGAGLGLYITKALADRLGGSLTLASVPGGGAVFTATLPVDLLDDRPINPSLSRRVATSEVLKDGELVPVLEAATLSDSPSYTVRILVVDDNVIGRKILMTLLNRMSRIEAISTAQAVDGVEALDLFTSFKPHLVLTDVSMPRMDGITAASEMRKVEMTWTRPRCKIYAITGLGSSDPRLQMDALRGSAALDGWLIKGQDKLSRIKEIVAEVREARMLSAARVEAET